MTAEKNRLFQKKMKKTNIMIIILFKKIKYFTNIKIKMKKMKNILSKI